MNPVPADRLDRGLDYAALAGRPFADLDPERLERARTLFSEGYPRRYRRANLDESLTMLAAFFHTAR